MYISIVVKNQKFEFVPCTPLHLCDWQHEKNFLQIFFEIFLITIKGSLTRSKFFHKTNFYYHCTLHVEIGQKFKTFSSRTPSIYNGSFYMERVCSEHAKFFLSLSKKYQNYTCIDIQSVDRFLLWDKKHSKYCKICIWAQPPIERRHFHEFFYFGNSYGWNRLSRCKNGRIVEFYGATSYIARLFIKSGQYFTRGVYFRLFKYSINRSKNRTRI